MKRDRREYQREYQRVWRRTRRLAWLEANGPCKQCGSWERLEVDHIDPSRKLDHNIWSWELSRREAELKKCQPLCHECHKKKTATYTRARFLGKPATPKKLTEELVIQIFREARAGISVRELGRKYKIAHTTVLDIREQRIWSWLTKSLDNPQLKLFPEVA